ncbi:MAG: aminotransferase class V-fold PLP-dependent enzyme, partial [Chloroflexi bacterium]|nr:aminotransferase class V-fold PLP-dependent enzyme [Chloroflexota bacterium]
MNRTSSAGMHRAGIYLDYSATTPIAPEVTAAMQPYFSDTFGNAASLHEYGRNAAAALDEAHRVVGCAIGARASEIVFTGCGTESDNLALRG